MHKRLAKDFEEKDEDSINLRKDSSTKRVFVPKMSSNTTSAWISPMNDKPNNKQSIMEPGSLMPNMGAGVGVAGEESSVILTDSGAANQEGLFSQNRQVSNAYHYEDMDGMKGSRIHFA